MFDFGTGIWDFVLSILVTFHIIIEFIHYTHEYISSKKEDKYLKDIHEYRKRSTKTKRLIQIQEDLNKIKKELKI